MAIKRKERYSMIERLTTLRQRITDPSSWDAGFVESLTNQANKGYTLSPRQIEILEQIEDRHSDEKLKSLAQWAENFSREQREKYEICLRYYKRTSYFKKQRQEYQSAYEAQQLDQFVPSMKDYTKIVENAYAQKVLSAYFSEPLYPVGTMVSLRSSEQTRRHIRSSKSTSYLVIKNNLPIRSACKGAKMYQLLPVGESLTVHFEERHLKAFKKPKTRSKGV